jgi:hypothetical protein
MFQSQMLSVLLDPAGWLITVEGVTSKSNLFKPSLAPAKIDFTQMIGIHEKKNRMNFPSVLHYIEDGKWANNVLLERKHMAMRMERGFCSDRRDTLDGIRQSLKHFHTAKTICKRFHFIHI